jgi:hypothetical protein
MGGGHQGWKLYIHIYRFWAAFQWNKGYIITSATTWMNASRKYGEKRCRNGKLAAPRQQARTAGDWPTGWEASPDMVSTWFQPFAMIPTWFQPCLDAIWSRAGGAMQSGVRESAGQKMWLCQLTQPPHFRRRCNGWGVNINSSSTRCKLSQLFSMAAEVWIFVSSFKELLKR